MKIINNKCENCEGKGKLYEWGRINGRPDLPTKVFTGACEECGGQGYVPFVLFTLDEAKAILKHCGITIQRINK